MKSFESVLFEQQDRVAVITLNRPEKRNVLSPQMRQELMEALRAAEEDEGIRAIIVTGAGTAWSAGAEMGRDSENERSNTVEEWLMSKRKLFLDQLWVRNMSKPTISAVKGYCLGAAFEWCLNLDMIIAAESARFGGPELHHGSIQLTRLPYYVGFQMAKKMYLTGDMITGKEAERIGLVMECVPDDELMETALRLAKRISQNSPQALMFNKWMIDSVADSMGWMNALSQGSTWDAVCHSVMRQPHTETAQLFDIKGVREFLKAREAKFPPEEVARGMVYR